MRYVDFVSPCACTIDFPFFIFHIGDFTNQNIINLCVRNDFGPLEYFLESVFFSLSPSSFLVGTNLNILCVIVLVVVLFFCGSITNELCKKPINNKLCSDKKYSMDDLHQF